MNADSLREFECFCSHLYETPDPAERQQAEQALVMFGDSPNCLNDCEYIVSNTQVAYAQMLAANAITRHLRKHYGSLTAERLLHLRDFGLRFLAVHPQSESYVLSAFVNMVSRSVKLGWYASARDAQSLETNIFLDTPTRGREFLSESPSHQLIGARLLAEIVLEMNTPETPLTRHRKVSAVFREKNLRDIFECVLTHLGNLYRTGQCVSNKLVPELLRAAFECLHFDFIGTSTDDTADDVGSVHIPNSWLSMFNVPTTLELFFGLYASLPPPASVSAMECLVFLSAVRRSLFQAEERTNHLEWLMLGIRNILETEPGLDDQANYHQFCRLVARVKTNYQLSEICAVNNYPRIIELLTAFTCKSLSSWHWSPRSIHYLLSLWQKLVNSMPYAKATNPHLLEEYSPRIAEAYIRCHLDAIPAIVQEGLIDDPLDDLDAFYVQLDQFAIIARCQYESTCRYLVDLFEQHGQEYQNSVMAGYGVDLTLMETTLAWLVYFASAVIGARHNMPSSAADTSDLMDGELSVRILRIMDIVNNRDPTLGSERIETAIIYFFVQFRRIYVGDSVQKATKVYQPLTEALGIKDQPQVLEVMIQKIILNLKCWLNNSVVIEKTLEFFTQLTHGYGSVRQMAKLNVCQMLMYNHTSPEFRFLDTVSSTRLRTSFYASISRLYVVVDESMDEFDQFLVPFDGVFNELQVALQSPSCDQRCRMAIVGLARDLRGVASSLNKKSTFMPMFKWLYPERMSVLLRSLQISQGDAEMTNVLLKLWCEIVQNRSKRLEFDLSSADGILLFRETSKVVVTYGQLVSQMGVIPPGDVYRVKYKGIATCFNILRHSVNGGYVNFGVFRLYNDPALDDALATFLALVNSVPLEDIMNYPKLASAYFSFLEVFTQSHMQHLTSLDRLSFQALLRSMTEGVKSTNVALRSQACASLDHVLKFHCEIMLKPTGKVPQFSALLQECGQPILQDLLSSMLHTIIFEDCQNTWSMSRPMLSLVLINEEFFQSLQGRLVAMQAVAHQPALRELFASLMVDVDRSTSLKNRDKFTQNLTLFKNSLARVPIQSVGHL